MRTYLLLATALLLPACGPTPDQQEAHRIVCEQSGYPVGSAAYKACVEREDNSYLPPLLRPAPPAAPPAPTPLM
jgi:hypothetical protein